jgi:hypothetical protein
MHVKWIFARTASCYLPLTMNLKQRYTNASQRNTWLNSYNGWRKYTNSPTDAQISYLCLQALYYTCFHEILPPHSPSSQPIAQTLAFMIRLSSHPTCFFHPSILFLISPLPHTFLLSSLSPSSSLRLSPESTLAQPGGCSPILAR